MEDKDSQSAAWLPGSARPAGPSLHPTQRKVLEAVAGLGQGPALVTSKAVRESLGLSQQLLNRHLRTLEAWGMLHLESPGAGLPLQIQLSPAGRCLLSQEISSSGQPPQTLAQHIRTAALISAPEPASPAPPAGPDFAPGGVNKFEAMTQALYRGLAPYLRNLPPQDFVRLVRQSLASALGRPLPEQSPEPTLPGTAGAAPARPPELSQAEQALEDGLAQSVHPELRGLPWHERTRELSNIWDQKRRRSLGLLTTYFNSFGPRWAHPQWEDFNRARRQADARGARYGDWVQAQFARLAQKDIKDVVPGELAGEEAVGAWESRFGSQAAAQPSKVAPPPYAVTSFNPQNPEHVAYANQVLEEVASLAQRVYGQDQEGPVRLLVQMLEQGNLPLAALDLRPEWKQRVLGMVTPKAATPPPEPKPAGRSPSGSFSPPGVII